MHLTFQALVLAALSLEGALAQPAHRHQHKHRRDLADVLHSRDGGLQSVDWNSFDWVKICAQPGACGKDKFAAKDAAPADRQVEKLSGPQVVAPSAGSSAPAPSAPAPSAVAPPSGPSSSSTPSTSGSSSGSSTGSCIYPSDVWNPAHKDTSRSAAPINTDPKYPGGITSADGPPFSEFGAPSGTHADGTYADYQGNVGAVYGHNMYPLQGCDVSTQQYSIIFENADSKPIQVAVWNKVGDNYKMPNVPGPITGAFRNAFWKFTLEAGKHAAFAVQANSQIAFSQTCNLGPGGDFACTWGEADFGSEPNKGCSGYDRSSIPNGMGNTGLLTVCAKDHDCSSKEANSFVSVSQTHAEGKLTIPDGPAHMHVTMGG